MTIHQVFCTVADLVADMEKPGGDEARLYKAIREASNVLEKEIGWFVPVTQTTKLRGNGKRYFYPYPPVLARTGNVLNNDVTMVEETDFSFMRPAWANGPYIGMELKNEAALSAWCALDTDSVQIPCRAGLYESTSITGATVQNNTQQEVGAGTLVVSNGGKVSPGMLLKIESEQELVTGRGDPTASGATLNGTITPTADVITFSSVDGLNVGEVIRIDFEQMLIKDKRDATEQAFVLRGWNNTGQVTHSSGAAVDVYRTFTVERGVNGTTAAVHANGVEISRYHAPEDVTLLTKEIATLILNKARSGYAGRTGDPERGTVFYNDIFPRYEIERIKQNYWIMMS